MAANPVAEQAWDWTSDEDLAHSGPLAEAASILAFAPAQEARPQLSAMHEAAYLEVPQGPDSDLSL
jgi:hypothetical protein